MAGRGSIDSLDFNQNGIKIAGSIVGATATELNFNDGATEGAVVASKTVVADSTKAIYGLREKVEVVTTNQALTEADSNKVILVGAANLVMTLPATQAGLKFTFVLQAAGLSGGTGLSISPQAADKIMGNGFTSQDNKDAILAGSGDREGDLIEVVGDGVDGYYISRVIGTWTREA